MPPSRPELVLLALSTTLGMQLVRVFVPSVQYLLYSRLRVPAVLAALCAVPIVAAAAALPALDRRLGRRRTIAVLAGGVGLARLGVQAWPGDPVVNAALAAAGSALFFALVPALLASREGAAPALLLGFALDTALHGLFLTYDYAWQSGVAPLALACLLAVAHAAALVAALRRTPDEGEPPQRAVAWAAVGCALFLEATVFQNVAGLATVTGLALPAALFWAVAGQAAAVWAACWSSEVARRTGWAVWALVLVAGLLPSGHAGLTIAGAVAAQAAFAVLLARVVEGRPPSRATRPHEYARTGLVLAGLVGAFYAPLGLRLPYSGHMVVLLAAAGVAYGARRALGVAGAMGVTGAARVGVAAAALLAFAAPLAVATRWREPAPAAPPHADGSVRVVSFNVHKGFDASGRLALDALAEVVEAERPDVVALQEVSRGQITEGNVDMASWLSQRFGLPCAYAPSGAGSWGQATWSRLRVVHAEHHLLPPLDLPTARSYGLVEVATGGAEPLRVVNTHYSARLGDAVRLVHSEALVRALGDMRRTVAAGDFNAVPGSTPMRPIFGAGLGDAIETAGLSPGYTAPSVAPTVRIDYVLYSADLEASDVRIHPTLASDHFAVAATIRPK